MRMRDFPLFSFFVIVLVSCSEVAEQESGNAIKSTAIQEIQDTVYQERNSNLPNVKTHWSDYELLSSTRATANDDKNGNSGELLGYSYKIGNTILGDPHNVGFPVIDIDKVSDYDPKFITKNHIGTSSINSFSYNSYDDFIQKSQYLKKSSSGFSLNILHIIKIGRRHKNTKVFSSYISDSIHAVYGEADIAYYNSEFKLNPSESSLHAYALACLTKSFMKNLYGSPAGKLLGSYGDFIMADYLTGGKITALYAGLARSSISVKDKEKLMDQEINASIDFKIKKYSGNISLDSLKIGNSSGVISGRKKFLDECYTSINTFGGKHGIETADRLLDIHKSSMDMSSWAQSLDNENTHSIVSIGDGGLLHISDVVLEDNYKKRLELTSEGYLDSFNKFFSTFIEISRYYVRYSSKYNKALYGIAAILNTRQGDKIILIEPNDKNLTDEELLKNNDNDVFFAKASKIAEEMKKVFDIEIKSNVYGRYNPQILDPLCETITVDFNNMHWFGNSNLNLKFIYNKESKIAFTVYEDDLEGDYVLDEYGLRDWFDANCTYKNISLGTVTRTFKIIGL